MKKYFNYKGRRIQYNEQGEGNIIVLIHGYLETSDIWKNYARRLSEKFRVISLDLPGHGGSDIYGEIHTMEFMATVLKDLCDDRGFNRIFLTGHSMGGYVTLAFADLYPEMLSGYCLFHSHPFPDTPEVIEKRKFEIRLLMTGKKDLFFPDSISRMYASVNLEKFRDALEFSKKISSEIPVEGLTAVLKGMMARPSRLSVMENGRVPCLWILGAMDNHIDSLKIQTRVKLPGNAEVHILNNSGHMGFIEEEETAEKILADFVRRSV